LFWVALGCGTAPGAGLTSGSGESDTGSITAGEELTGAETGLYETGPASLPVPIAKLEAMDPRLIDMAFEVLETPSINQNYLKYQTTSTGTFTVTGSTGFTTGNFVLIFNLTTELGAVFEVVDQAVVATIAGSQDDQIAFAIANVLDVDVTLDEIDEIGVPLILEVVDGGTIITLSNTNRANTLSSLLSVGDNLYFSLLTTADDASSSELHRLNIATQESEIISSSILNRVQVIAEQTDAAAGTDYNIIFTTEDASTKVVEGVSEVWETQENLYTDAAGLVYYTGLYPTLKQFYSSEGNLFHCVTLWAEGTSNNSYVGRDLLMVNSLGASSVIIDSDDYLVVDCAQIPGTDFIYVLAHFKAGSAGLEAAKVFKLDSTLEAASFASAETIFTMPDTSPVRGFDVDDVNGNYIAISGLLGAGLSDTFIIVYDVDSATRTKINDSQISGIENAHRVQVTTDGVVVTCNQTSSEGKNIDDHYLVAHRTGTDAIGDFYQIVGGEDYNPCDYDFIINDENQLIFMSSDTEVTTVADDFSPQIIMTDMDNYDYSLGVLDS